ncbi:MAG: trypsin-like peptidase domain-containing protein [Archangium sp.]|nr:trypsin-like peptidase domain-containing protein [Archangium sp.]
MSTRGDRVERHRRLRTALPFHRAPVDGALGRQRRAARRPHGAHQRARRLAARDDARHLRARPRVPRRASQSRRHRRRPRARRPAARLTRPQSALHRLARGPAHRQRGVPHRLPGRDRKFPQPAITRGVLSRVREARFENLTFLQSDATIVGGQSGGALVSSKGDVIGISGLIGIEQFALVLSGADVLARLPRISESPSPLARSVVTPKPSLKQPFSFDALHQQAAFFFHAEDGDQVRLEANAAHLSAFDCDLAPAEAAGPGVFRFDVTGPQMVVVKQDEATKGTLVSDHVLSAFVDPDDGRDITLGVDLHGVIDFPTDEDRYVLQLDEGQRVFVRVDGVLDALCSVFDESGDEELAAARVGEGGLGMAAELRFEAPRTGRFVVSVAESSPEGPAGYHLRVTKAEGKPRGGPAH